MMALACAAPLACGIPASALPAETPIPRHPPKLRREVKETPVWGIAEIATLG